MKAQWIGALAASIAFCAPAQAQQTVFMPIVIEVSGSGAVSGTNFRDGALMAIDEINAKGGILKRKINAPVSDTQTNPGVSRAQVQKAIDGDPYVILGPVFSGSVKVNMVLAQQAEIPQMTGAEAAEITQLGNDYIFRTSFGQQVSMPKMAAFVANGIKAKTVAFLWVNNDYGKGGRDVFFKEMKARNIKIVADVSTEAGQVDFAADVVKLKSANADAIFIYVNEEECARVLREARKQDVKVPLIGETNVISQKVIDLAGDTANGVKGHVGLTADAPIKAVQEFRDKFQKRYKYLPDHNGIKGYTAVYAVKYATEKMGKFDRKALAKSLHGMTIKPEQEPGILMETTWDAHGDIDRISFLVEVVDGKQKVVQVLPKLGQYLADFLQLAVAGIATGGIYALVAVGFVLLWQTSQTINFAQGEFVMLPAFFVLAAMKFGGLAFPLALAVGFVVALLVLGLLFKQMVVDPILRHGVLPLVISTLGLAILMKEGVKEFYAAEAQAFPGVWPTTNFTLGGAVISAQSLIIIAVAVAAVGLLQYFLGATRTGRQMQATAQNPLLARVLGIPVERMILYTFLVNAALVALASFLVSPVYLAKFTNGELLGLAAFVAAIVGGFNQVRGAIAGGVLLGVADNFVAAYWSAQYRAAIPLFLLIVVILWRPQGLLGRAEERTV